MRRRLDISDDRGESLLELVIAILILGICVVAIGTGIALSVKMSAVHRAQSLAQEFLHNYAETIGSGYQPCNGCATDPDYVNGLPTPNGFGAPTESVSYWDGTAFKADRPAADPGLQQVTLNLTSNDGLVKESLVVVLRQAT